MDRRHRLTRSHDFEQVYRKGRSVSTRFFVLYVLSQGDEPGDARLGLAVPRAVGPAVVRNRLKRQLRELWRSRSSAGPGRDYVLIVRPGLAEAAEARGSEWLGSCLDEVVEKAAA